MNDADLSRVETLVDVLKEKGAIRDFEPFKGVSASPDGYAEITGTDGEVRRVSLDPGDVERIFSD